MCTILLQMLILYASFFRCSYVHNYSLDAHIMCTIIPLMLILCAQLFPWCSYYVLNSSLDGWLYYGEIIWAMNLSYDKKNSYALIVHLCTMKHNMSYLTVNFVNCELLIPWYAAYFDTTAIPWPLLNGFDLYWLYWHFCLVHLYHWNRSVLYCVRNIWLYSGILSLWNFITWSGCHFTMA